VVTDTVRYYTGIRLENKRQAGNAAGLEAGIDFKITDNLL
jgi:hypothetical protein